MPSATEPASLHPSLHPNPTNLPPSRTRLPSGSGSRTSLPSQPLPVCPACPLRCSGPAPTEPPPPLPLLPPVGSLPRRYLRTSPATRVPCRRRRCRCCVFPFLYLCFSFRRPFYPPPWRYPSTSSSGSSSPSSTSHPRPSAPSYHSAHTAPREYEPHGHGDSAGSRAAGAGCG